MSTRYKRSRVTTVFEILTAQRDRALKKKKKEEEKTTEFHTYSNYCYGQTQTGRAHEKKKR